MGKITVGVQQVKQNVVKHEDGSMQYDITPMQQIFDLLYQCGVRVIAIDSHYDCEFRVTCELIRPTKYNIFVGKLLDDFPYDKFQLTQLQR